MSLNLRLGVVATFCGLWAALSCGNPAPVTRGNVGSGANTGAGAMGGVGQGGNIVGAGASGGSLILTGGTSGGEGQMGCYQYALNWEPEIPTVQIVVDRSTSMTEFGLWAPIRDALLPVIQQLETDVRFGFTAYTGGDGAGCPAGTLQLDSVPAALNNYATIQGLYSTLEPPPPSAKGNTPTGPALDFARDQILADTVPGAKFVLLVTDGQPDYCDDPNPNCPTDLVIYKLQQLHAAGIPTLVFGFEGVSSGDANLVAGLNWALQSFANAGAGQPVGVRPGLTREQYGVPLTPGAVVFWDECKDYAPWTAEHAAAGLPEWYPMSTYSAPAGTATVYKPNPTDSAALVTEFGSVLSAVKSCTFDLSAEIEEGSVKVDLARLDLVNVAVVDEMGASTDIALDTTAGQGWRMASETQLVLEGAACDLWRKRESRTVEFDFPCDVIIIVPPQ